VRIQNENVPIEMGKTLNFFNNRSKVYSEENPVTSVLYQDKHPEIARERHKSEVTKIRKSLCITTESKILDIGCGVGRWAFEFLDTSPRYVGTDFSQELIDIAKERFKGSTNFRFHTLSAQDTNYASIEEKFDLVIISGVLLYLNDDDVKKVFDNLETLLPEGKIYIREPIGLETRLTLINEWSQELSDYYSAIYRTESEIMKLLGNSELSPKIKLLESDWLHEKHLNNRKETAQKFWIWNVK
jgi:SAM-dependent methyltransferase